jgi:hypothetical protein
MWLCRAANKTKGRELGMKMLLLAATLMLLGAAGGQAQT